MIKKQHALFWLVFCLLIAAVLRFPDLTGTPPGVHYDEAANGILAGDIAYRGYRPIFITSYTGKEVIFFYAAAAVMRLVGESLFSLRLTAVFLSLLTIAATYAAVCQLWRDRRLALWTAALLAVSFWHLLFSRLGFRAISQPLAEALTIALLWSWLRRPERSRWLTAATTGIALGLTGYTYLAARLFPVTLLVGLTPLWLTSSRWRQRWVAFLPVLLTALLVMTPLLFFFWQHPDSFWVRISQAGGSFGWAEGWHNYGRSLAMFGFSGDPYLRFNIPLRPIWGWLGLGLGLLGWLWGWSGWWRRQSDLDRAAWWLLLTFPFIMLLPTALAFGEIIPSNLRAIGLLPFLLVWPAVGGRFMLDRWLPPRLRRLRAGLVAAADDTGRRPYPLFFRLGQDLQAWPRLRRQLQRLWQQRVTAVFMLILLGGGLHTGLSYFGEWRLQPQLFYEMDGDLAAAAAYLDSTETGTAQLFMAARHYRHPTVAFLSQKYDQLHWLPAGNALVIPAEGSSRYIYPRTVPAPDWALPYLSRGEIVSGPPGPDGQPAFTAYTVFTPVPVRLAQQLDINFSNQVRLLGYEIGNGPAGGSFPLTLQWQIDQLPPPAAAGSPPAGWQPFIHVEDSWGYRWSSMEPNSYPAEQWQLGDTIVQRLMVPLPYGMPPVGEYKIKVGLFRPDTGARLARLDGNGRYAGDSYILSEPVVTAAPQPAAKPAPPIPIGAELLPGIELLGYERWQQEVWQGAEIGVSFWWWADQGTAVLNSRLELEQNQTGFVIGQTVPVHGSYPFSAWQPGQFLRDNLSLPLPDQIPAGEYRLVIRFLDAADQTVYTADLGPLTVLETERLFQRPQLPYPFRGEFNGEILLFGYRIEDQGGHQFELELGWEALVSPAQDYTVFVHLLQQDGQCCLWQQDVMPRQGQYPTSWWLPGEVVLDSYPILLPTELLPGSYPIEVGLYVAETGQRLQLVEPVIRSQDAAYLRPLIIK